jgi:hypothetical protein
MIAGELFEGRASNRPHTAALDLVAGNASPSRARGHSHIDDASTTSRLSDN